MKELSQNLLKAIELLNKSEEHLNNIGYIALTVIKDNEDIKKELKNLEKSLKKALQHLNIIAKFYKV